VRLPNRQIFFNKTAPAFPCIFLLKKKGANFVFLVFKRIGNFFSSEKNLAEVLSINNKTEELKIVSFLASDNFGGRTKKEKENLLFSFCSHFLL